MHIAVGLFGNFQQALHHTVHLFACEALQERVLGKLGRGPTLTTRGSGRDSSDHPWNQCLGRLSVKPLDLDRQHLDARHLRVEERDHPCKGIRYLVRYEQKTETLCLQIRGYALSEALHIRLFILLQQSGKFIIRIKVSVTGLVKPTPKPRKGTSGQGRFRFDRGVQRATTEDQQCELHKTGRQPDRIGPLSPPC